jgi:division protein 1
MAKQRRRLIRGGMAEEELGGKMGLKRLGDRARGLLTEGGEEGEGSESSADVGGRRSRRKAREKRRAGEGKHVKGKYHLEDLVKQADEIAQDKDNLQTRSVSYVSHRLVRHGADRYSRSYTPKLEKYPPRSIPSKRSDGG